MTAKKSNKPTAAKSKTKAPAKPNSTPAVAVRAHSKAAAVIALLRREGGATLEEMMAATGWQEHSVRGFMAGTLKKRHGLTVISAKTDEGRKYQLAGAVQS